MTPEIAFTVALDRVRFSPQPMERKVELSRELMAAIHSSAAYSAAVATGRVITLDTGDGASLVFFGDPLTAIDAALDIHHAVNGPMCALPLRVGIHAGPVVRRTDVSGKPNVDGHGIDLAFRVMAAADGSAVLVSEAYASILRAFEEWEKRLGPPMEIEAKHGQKVQVCTVTTRDARSPQTDSPSAAGESRLAIRNPQSPMNVALVYKRHAEPDGALLAKLESCLRAAGHQVFIDRHMSIGVEWAQEIERQLRSADAVIPLLSDRAGDSETMLYELQVACDERDKRKKPAILPVRIGSDEPLGGEIGRLIARFHYFHWKGERDSDRLWREIDEALRRPEPPAELIAPIEQLEQPGGAVPLDSPFYIERLTDAQFHQAVARRDSIVLLKGARQMGKTSLLARGLQTAREQGWSVALTDFQTFSSSQLDTDERLYKSLMHALRSQLKLDVELQWNDWLGANANLEQFIGGSILPRVEGHLVWAMDEVDRLFSRPYATDFFGIVRSWHNRRALDPTGLWQKLTIAIAYATEAHLFITDLNQSPFNVGTRLSLEDFTLEQVGAVNELYGVPLRSERQIGQYHELLNGQPYLTRRGLDELVREHQTLDQIMELADHDEGVFGDHLRRILFALSNDPALGSAVRALLRGDPIDGDSFYRLRTGGVLHGDSPSSARFRCRIYETYLRRHLG